MKSIIWKPIPSTVFLFVIAIILIVTFTYHAQLQKSCTLNCPTLQKAGSSLKFKPCTKQFNRENIKYKIHKNIWQNVTTPKQGKIYLFRAYYDDRPSHKGKLFIQILAVGTFPSARAYAFIWTKNSVLNEAVADCSATKHGNPTHTEGLVYYQFFFSCEIKKNLTSLPKSVSLSFDKCSVQSNLISVYIPERIRKHKFSVCVETSYGNIDPHQIIEWVEANKLMGVTLFNVYPCNMSQSNLNIFRQYESEGIMRITMTPSPLADTSWENQMLSSPASFNDCMLRQMYSAEYIIPLDFDEIISPRRQATNYSSLIAEVDRVRGNNDAYPTYTFRMGLFFTTCGVDMPGEINVIRHIKRTVFFGNVKSIVNPRLCLSVFNHYCRVDFPMFQKRKRLDVEPEVGLVNHYRKAWSSRYCKMLKNDGVIDVIFKDKFAAPILKQYRATVKRFKELHLL